MATAIATIVSQAREVLLERNALPPPGAPQVSQQGTPGSTSRTYKITAVTAAGETDGSPATVTLTGNAVLSVTNYDQLTWVAVPKALSYNIYRFLPNPSTLIGNTTLTTFNHVGAVGTSVPVPTINTSGLTRPFWTDTELTDLATLGIQNLWGAILDVHGEHYLTVDETNVSLAANASQLTGVPADCFRVYLIEPRDTTSDGAYRNFTFTPRKYNSPDFTAARSRTAYDVSSGGVVFYSVSNAGAPIAAPTILTAPKFTGSILLRLAYNQTLTVGQDNPIPGESDNAVKAWIVAYAYAKEAADRMPHPGWIQVYATEKQSLLTRLTPRQEQEPEVVADMFGDW